MYFQETRGAHYIYVIIFNISNNPTRQFTPKKF